MKEFTSREILSLKEILQIELSELAKAKAVRELIRDKQLASMTEAAVIAAEVRIRGIQQLISGNDLIAKEVQ